MAGYEKPSSGIPKSDLAEDVRTSLGKADTAIQDISSLVPKTTTIAGVDMQDNITKSELQEALNVEDNSQENVIETIKVNGTSQSVSNKSVNISVPTNNNQLVNGEGFQKASDVNSIIASLKGANNGLAELGNDGKVPSSQLPSYVDDVLEYDSYSAFPVTGETGKIYVALDTNKTYRWSGSAYVEISESLALGETSSTAYRGDRGKTAYSHATESDRLTTAKTSGLYKIATTGEGHIKSATEVEKSDLTSLGVEDESNKKNYIDDTLTDDDYVGGKAINNAFNDVKDRLNVLERKVGRAYSVVRKITDNSSSAWTRADNAVGLVANAKVATAEAVQNDFDNIYPWCDIKDCNVDSNGVPTHFIGETGFSREEEVYVRIPKHWIHREQYEVEEDNTTNKYEKITIYDYNAPNSQEIAEYLVGKYHTSQVTIDGVATHVSMSGTEPLNNTTKGTFRTKAKAKGSKWSLLDWHYWDLCYLYLVEYADYNSETKLGHGFINSSIATSLLEENSTNRIVISSLPDGLYVGKTISIGTDRGNYSIARSRTITTINDFDNGTITGKEIIFDGEAVNLTTSSKIWGSPQISGSLDSFGNTSGCLVSDMYHAVTYRGIENIFGHLWQHIDGINIKDCVTYVCYDRTKYANDKFDNGYVALGYTNASSSDKYIKEVGYDNSHQLVAMPTVVGGTGASDSTYLCDNYWCSTGNRILFVGGSASTGGSKCGLFASNCYYNSSHSYWNFGARLLIHTS